MHYEKQQHKTTHKENMARSTNSNNNSNKAATIFNLMGYYAVQFFGQVRLRGGDDEVDSAEQVLREFQADNWTTETPVALDDEVRPTDKPKNKNNADGGIFVFVCRSVRVEHRLRYFLDAKITYSTSFFI